MVTPVYNPKSAQGFSFLYILQHLLFFFILSILTCIRWYLTVVLICIFLVLVMLNIFSYPFRPSVCLLWKMYIYILCPLFKLDCLVFYYWFVWVFKHIWDCCRFSVAKLCLTLSLFLSYPSLSPGVCSNSCALSQWCYLTISSSVVPFSFCPPPFPGSRSFPVSRPCVSSGQSIGASASVLPVNIQDWFL